MIAEKMNKLRQFGGNPLVNNPKGHYMNEYKHKFSYVTVKDEIRRNFLKV